MSISKETLKGYILEEVLAYLIKNTGYRLLVDPIQDPNELAWRGNGLVVKGRGSVHQVDVLGQLEWIPAFTFPLRLFLEAKFRAGRMGIGSVRNAVGVVQDINQNNFPSQKESITRPKYTYAYALFSTSGFSKPAIDMAIAHQISLIDLSGPEFAALLEAIDGGATNLTERDRSLAILDTPEDGDDDTHERVGHTDERGMRIDPPVPSMDIAEVRTTLRNALGTQPTGVYREANGNLGRRLDDVYELSRLYAELFVGMANGPYMLLLKATDPHSFLAFIRLNATHQVTIHWSMDLNEGKTWKIRPVANPDAYELSFTLPARLAEWVFGKPSEARVRALAVKSMYLSDISIYRKTATGDQLIRLQFNPDATREFVRELNRGRE